MDILLGKVTQQAMNYAIRSGVTITAGYAIKQSSRLLKSVDNRTEREELRDLQERLNSKIKIISPAIDMIELISARGNTSLESAVSLTKSLRWEIQALGQRLAEAANAEEAIHKRSTKSYDRAQHDRELKQIIQAIKRLLTRIEDAVPLINLAITASGASLSSTLPSTVSPSRLLQASTFLTAGDAQYGTSSSSYVQIGPPFTLSMYMLFMGHLRPQNEEEVRESTWKEVIHKADVRLMRVPLDALYCFPGQRPPQSPTNGTTNFPTDSQSNGYSSPHAETSIKPDEYAYQLLIVEDLDDDRVHTFEDDEPQPGPFHEVEQAGIREIVPIHELSKIFYADTGKILNIGSDGETNSPVLLLKRDPDAAPPRRMMDRNEGEDADENAYATSAGDYDHDDSQALVSSQSQRQRHLSRGSSYTQPRQLTQTADSWRLPSDLDPEWIAFEVYVEAEDSDVESENDQTAASKPSRSYRTASVDPQAASALSQFSITTPNGSSPSPNPPTPQPQQQIAPTLPPIRTSLSLLETILRLLSLQQFQQQPHLSIPDELLTFFLSESASTGAASNDVQERKRLREEARRRVGFDPYDESPVKRRGEEYQYQAGSPARWDDSYGDGNGEAYERYGSPIDYRSPSYVDEGYDTYQSQARPAPSTPQTPSLLLKNRSRSGTPDRASSSPSGKYAPPRQWPGGRGGLK